jgi:hypothetical protein
MGVTNALAAVPAVCGAVATIAVAWLLVQDQPAAEPSEDQVQQTEGHG